MVNKLRLSFELVDRSVFSWCVVHGSELMMAVQGYNVARGEINCTEKFFNLYSR